MSELQFCDFNLLFVTGAELYANSFARVPQKAGENHRYYPQYSEKSVGISLVDCPTEDVFVSTMGYWSPHELSFQAVLSLMCE